MLCCTTAAAALRRTAVVAGSVRGCVHGLLFYFYFFAPAIAAPRAGIVQRTTISILLA